MLQLEVYGDLVPWTAARRKGRIYYDPKDVEKKRIRWQIATQYKGELHCGPMILDFMFYFPIPKATSKIRRKQMLSGRRVRRCEKTRTFWSYGASKWSW